MRVLKILLFALFVSLLVLICLQSCGGPGESEVVLGVVAPFSGGSAKYGEELKRGYEMGIEEVNEGGGVRGHQVRLVFEDSEGTPQGALAAARKLITVDKVPLIFGCFGSSATLAVAPVAEQNRVILFSSSSSSPRVSESGDYIFRNEISDVFGARETAARFLDLGYHSIAVLYINNDFGIDFAEVVGGTYAEREGQVVISESFEQDATDFRSQLLKIKSAEVKAIFIVAYSETVLILQQMKELGLSAQVLSTALFEDKAVLEMVPDLAEGALYTYYGTFDPESADSAKSRFAEAFEIRYGAQPGYYGPIAYDAAKIVCTAAESGGLTGEQIKTALYAIRDFPGLTGTTSVDSNGDVIKPVIVKTVRNGKFVVL